MKKIQKTILFISIQLLLGVFIIGGVCFNKNQQMAARYQEIKNIQGSSFKSDMDIFPKEDYIETISNTQNPPLEPVIFPIEEKEIKLMFCGDIYFKDYYLEAYDKNGINGIVSEQVLELMTGADLMIANQEFAFSTRGVPAKDKQFTFKTPPERVQLFKELGIDLVTLANNHTLDFGREALSDTFVTLDNAQIPYIGAGENLERAKKMEIFEVNGKRIGFVAASRVIPVVDWNAGKHTSGMLTTYSPEALLKVIEENRPNCDVLAVYVHWGVERNEYPEEYQLTMAKQYIDAGADIVMGSHPHVLQGVEYYKKKPIVYSLGNYIFSNNTKQTMLAEITISGDDIHTRLIPVSPEQTSLTLITGEREKNFYQYMEKISFGVEIEEDGFVRDKAE